MNWTGWRTLWYRLIMVQALYGGWRTLWYKLIMVQTQNGTHSLLYQPIMVQTHYGPPQKNDSLLFFFFFFFYFLFFLPYIFILRGHQITLLCKVLFFFRISVFVDDGHLGTMPLGYRAIWVQRCPNGYRAIKTSAVRLWY